MNLDSISETWLGKLASRLPPDRAWVKFLKAGGKAALSRRGIVGGRRVAFPGLEDAVLERFYAPGPGPEEVLVEARFTAISPGTERAYYRNLPNFTHGFPFFPGYSGVGVVKAVGRRAKGFQVGERVAGVLKHASSSIAAVSDLVGLMGDMDAMDSMDAAFVTIGVIAMVGVRAAKLKKGETLAVLGQGIIGQIANQIAKAAGAGKVVAAARTEGKKGMSQEHGADSFVALSGGPAPDDLADKVIDASGSSAAFETALRMTRPGGTVVILGSPADCGVESTWPRAVWDKRLTVRGAHIRNLAAEGSSYRERAGEFLGLIKDDKVRVSSLVTHRFQPEQASEVYRRLADGESGLVGAVFEWKQKAKRRAQSA